MINKIRKIIRFFLKRNKDCPDKRSDQFLEKKGLVHSQKGQAAIILIFVIAICIIFFAASVNMGIVSQSKALVTIASNNAASLMASQMASYGHYIFRTSLGGHFRVCGLTVVVSYIVAIIVLIICIYFGAYAEGAQLALAIIALALALGGLVLTLVYVQPTMQDLWSKQITDTMPMADQFIENGVRVALQNSVTDRKMVPDVYDDDRDFKFGFEPTGYPKDETSRYGIYYSARLKESTPQIDNKVKEFVAYLKEFVREGSDRWGLYDNTKDPACTGTIYDPNATNTTPSECNPCCVPEHVTNPSNGMMIPFRPECCDLPVGDPMRCGGAGPANSVCRKNSSYAEYPFVYEQFYENDDNNFHASTGFISFREAIGRDDLTKDYTKQQTDPTQQQVLDFGDVWRLEDATNFYDHLAFDPNFPPYPDYSQGVYPYFYKIEDWGVDLRLSTNPATNPFAFKDEYCYWCAIQDQAGNPIPSPTAPCNDCKVVSPNIDRSAEERTQLVLPRNPSLSQDKLKYDLKPWVNSTNDNVFGIPPFASDKIGLTSKLSANSGDCAQQVLKNPGVKGFWKRGGDMYCSKDWPYEGNCAKHQHGMCTEEDPEDPAVIYNLDCDCSSVHTDPALFQEDIVDDLRKDIAGFLSWAEAVFLMDGINLTGEFTNWYDEGAYWFEPVPDADPPTNCFICEPEGGKLWDMLDKIEFINDVFTKWKNTSYQSLSCDEVWCVPKNGCPGVSNAENGTLTNPYEPFDYNGNGIPGDMEDVISCLNYNIEGYDYTNNHIKATGTNEGNDIRFQRCADTFSTADCQNLPRSMAPLPYDPNSFDPLQLHEPYNETDLSAFTKCLTECNDANCKAMPEYDHAATPELYFPFDVLEPGSGITNPFSVPTFNKPDFCVNLGEEAAPVFRDILMPIITDINSSLTYDYIVNTKQSYYEAENQVAKFKLRRDFLSNRLLNVEEMVGEPPVGPQATGGIFKTAERRFTDFLTGPARNIIQHRINFNPDELAGLPYQATYVWRDDDDPATGKIGMWHAVRAEVRAPGRCDNQCGLGGGPDPEWPKVKTYTRSAGCEQCFELREETTTGLVKSKVTRWDQNPRGDMLKFPNDMPIWSYRVQHPSRPEIKVTNLDAHIRNSCQNASVMKVNPPEANPGVWSPFEVYGDGFMLNRFKPTDPVEKRECWNIVSRLLTRGYTSKTCAQYYYHPWLNRGFGHQFVECDASW